MIQNSFPTPTDGIFPVSGFFYPNFITEMDIHDERYAGIDNSLELVVQK